MKKVTDSIEWLEQRLVMISLIVQGVAGMYMGVPDHIARHSGVVELLAAFAHTVVATFVIWMLLKAVILVLALVLAVVLGYTMMIQDESAS